MTDDSEQETTAPSIELPDQETRAVLIPDAPSRTDEFDAKAHERVAAAITDLVITEPGGCVIGLEGTWGSGKSTVVRMVCERLKAADSGEQNRSVIIDAWAHQGDPLRRTFLETIIDELESEWLSKSVAQNFKDELSGRRTKTHTSTTSRLTLEGSLAGVLALFIPLGSVLLANKFTKHHRGAQIAGLALLLAPLLVIAGFGIAKLVGIMLGGKKKAEGERRRKLADLNPLGFFTRDNQTATTAEGVQRGEPTSVEFEDMFSRVLDSALKRSRRLILILDNLDRIDPEAARNVLATLQTFTNASPDPDNSWRKRVWTLIPYDVDGLDRLWANGQATDEESPLAAPFMEKLFAVRFETPPLVLSDWRHYLRDLLNQAFPGCKQSDVDCILRLRAVYPGVEPNGIVAREAPTPRQLKQFTNQIGAVRRQRVDIPLPHIAYYALLRRDHLSVPTKLIDAEVPHPNLSHLFGTSIRDDLAAIHFGTTKELAQQLLLRGALEAALAKRDIAALERFKDRPGFAEALDSLNLADRVGDGGVELTRIVAVLNSAGALTSPGLESWSKDMLLPLAKGTASWTLSGRESGEGVAILADLCSTDDEQVRDFIGRIERTARAGDDKGQLQLDGVAGLADTLLVRNRGAKSLRVNVELPSDRLVTSLAYLMSHVKDRRSRALIEVVNAAPAAIATALVTAAGADGERSVIGALNLLRARVERVDLKILAVTSSQWLRDQDPRSKEQFAEFVEILNVVKAALPSDPTLPDLADDGTLMNLVWVANNSDWQPESAATSMLHLSARPTLTDPQVARESANGLQLLRQCLNNPDASPPLVASQLQWMLAHKDEAVGLLLTVKQTDDFRPWVNHNLKELAKADAFVIRPEDFMRDWAYVKTVLGDDEFGKVARLLLSKSNTRSMLLDKGKTPELAAELILASDDDTREQVQQWASEIVRGSTTQQWESALKDLHAGPLVSLALDLSEVSASPSDPIGLNDAFHSHFKALAAGQPAWQGDEGAFMKIVSLLKPQSRHVLASQLCAELEGIDGKLGPALIPMYGKFLAGEQAFRAHPKLPNVVDRLIAHEDWESIQWIVDMGRLHSDTLATAGRETELEHLRGRLQERINDAPETAPDALKDLATLLGIDLGAISATPVESPDDELPGPNVE